MTKMIDMTKVSGIIGREEFISTREAAKRLGVALSTVQVWVEAGVLPAWKTAGGHRRIPADAITAFSDRQLLSLRKDPPLQSGKLLLVEDDPVMLHIYRQQIATWKLPIELLIAEDGFAGLILMGRHKPDVVITDLSMPGMDGVKMLRRVAMMDSDMSKSVIVITGLSPEEIAAKGGLPADIPIYPKPVSFSALRPLVEFKLSKSKVA
jgi:excisionase family DNA binding protein